MNKTELTRKQSIFTLVGVLVVSLLSVSGIALPYPILAPLFLESPPNGFTYFMEIHPKILLGVVLAIYPLGLMIGSIFLGGLSDQYGRKKVLSVSLVVAALGYLLSGWAIVKLDFVMFCFARLITGLSEGNISIARAVVAELHPQIDKTKGMSLIYATTYGGYLIGPLAGGALMSYGAQSAFYVAAVATLVCTVATYFLITETSTPSPEKRSIWTLAKKENSLTLLKEPQIKQVFYIYLILTLGLNAFYEFFPVWLVEKFQATSMDIAYYTVSQTAFMIIASVFWVPKVKAKFGKATGVKAGAFSLSFLLVIFPLSNNHSAFLLFALTGIAIAIYNGLLPVYVSDRYESHGHGKVFGLLTTTFCLSNVIISLVGGVMTLFGSHWVLVLGGLLVFTAAVAFRHFDNTTEYTPAETTVSD